MSTHELSGVGDRIRSARKGKGLSLQNVADDAGVSAATLSRIETNKQALDLSLFLHLARILGSSPSDLFGDTSDRPVEQELADRIIALESTERLRLWSQLRINTKTARDVRGQRRLVAMHLEELLAQLDYLRDEVEALRRNVPR